MFTKLKENNCAVDAFTKVNKILQNKNKTTVQLMHSQFTRRNPVDAFTLRNVTRCETMAVHLEQSDNEGDVRRVDLHSDPSDPLCVKYQISDLHRIHQIYKYDICIA